MKEKSLEEAIASVSFLVYGHTCEVLGLQCMGYTLSTSNPVLTISYNNRRYMPRHVLKLPAFCVGSAQGSQKAYKDLVCPPQYDPRIVRCPVIIGPSNTDDPLQWVKPERLREEFILDGTHFIGKIIYYPNPLFFSSNSITSDQTYLIVQSNGPSLEELYELIKALHVLNPDLRA